MKKHNNNILVPIDFHDQSLIALEQSYNLAKLLNLEITLLYVHEETGLFSQFFTEDQGDIIQDTIQGNLDKLAKQAKEKAGVKINTMIAKGKIHSKITEIAELINAKFIVIGLSSDVEEGKKRNVGANSSRVIRYAKCPVITIAGKSHFDGCRSILLPLDLSKETRQKVTKAIEVAKYFNATIKVMSALLTDDKEVINHLNAQINQVKKYIEEKGISATAEIVKGSFDDKHLYNIILKYAKKQGDIDLIIIMTQQEDRFVEFFVGSSASEIIRNSDIPVMTIRPLDMTNASKIVVGY